MTVKRLATAPWSKESSSPSTTTALPEPIPGFVCTQALRACSAAAQRLDDCESCLFLKRGQEVEVGPKRGTPGFHDRGTDDLEIEHAVHFTA
jgi:hypothetical protein